MVILDFFFNRHKEKHVALTDVEVQREFNHKETVDAIMTYVIPHGESVRHSILSDVVEQAFSHYPNKRHIHLNPKKAA